jgi:hypothetical protein
VFLGELRVYIVQLSSGDGFGVEFEQDHLAFIGMRKQI